MATLQYTIDEIAKWEANREVDIPALQRGLVWSPRQVELLWDSIFRGFPIGAFVFTPVIGNEEQLTSNDGEHAKYFLLDGQQRYNAIKSAFTPHADGAKSVLWVDFMPPAKINGSSCMTVGGFPPHKFAWPLFYGLLSRSSGPRNFD